MRHISLSRTLSVSFLIFLPSLIACGGAEGGQTFSFDAGGSGGGAGTGSGVGNGGDGGHLSGGSGGLGDGGVAPLSADAACATDHAGATLGESYLVVVMDRSDSMSQDSKWPSCTSALDDFFSDPKSAGIEASLTFLPEVTAGTSSTSASPSFLCTSSSYAAPDVPLTALPSPLFASTIATQSLEFGTPTLAALGGAGTQAEAVLAAHPGSKVVIVLATDGLPYGCTDDTITTVSAEAAGFAKEGILTYVIGVGTATSNLDAIADAGGTGTAFIVPTGSGATTASAFLSAIESVAGKLISCDFPIPSPPSGETIDYGEVNVVYTPSTGTSTTLAYSPGCTNADGWEYDNPAVPTKIELCTQACTTAQGDKASTIDILFGCATEGSPP